MTSSMTDIALWTALYGKPGKPALRSVSVPNAAAMRQKLWWSSVSQRRNSLKRCGITASAMSSRTWNSTVVRSLKSMTACVRISFMFTQIRLSYLSTNTLGADKGAPKRYAAAGRSPGLKYKALCANANAKRSFGAQTVRPNPMALSCQAVGPAPKAGPKSLESPAGVGSIVFLKTSNWGRARWLSGNLTKKIGILLS